MLENFNVDIPNSWLDSEKENYCVFAVKGDDYMPYFVNGDVLLICKDNSKIESNDIVLCDIDGNIEIRRFCIHNEDTQTLEGITPYIPPQLYTKQTIHGFVFLRITNYRQEAANNGTNETD